MYKCDADWPVTRCDMCGGEFKQVRYMPNYMEGEGGRKTIQLFMLMECKECQTMMLDISPSEMESHLRSASYTNPANYDRFLRERVKFFDWLIGKYLGGLPRDGSAKVLDFGTSYGHMTRMLAERGFKVYGVEINDRVRELAKKEAPKAKLVKTLDELEDEGSTFSAALILDSLYYCTKPKATLSRICGMLKPGGAALIRMANRRWYFKAKTLIGSRPDENPLGDARWTFSLKGMRIALASMNMSEPEATYSEKSKNMGAIKDFLYGASGFVGDATKGRIAFTPGILLYSEKR